MRRRDAVDLARLAQDALRALSPAPSPGVANTGGTWDRWANAEAGRAAAGTALLHLVRALRSEAARNRPHRPDDPEQVAAVREHLEADQWRRAVPTDRLVVLDPTDGTEVEVHRQTDSADCVATISVEFPPVAFLTRGTARDLGRWLLAVAADEGRPS